MNRAYPAVKRLESEVLEADGYVNFRCTVKDGRLEPALSPLSIPAPSAGGVFKNGRTFVAYAGELYKVRWTNPEGVLGADGETAGSGWVSINEHNGRIQKLIVYKGRIIIVCEYGLAALTAYGSPDNFKLAYIDGKVPHISGSTAAVVLDKLVFFAEDGLYAFDGIKIAKLNLSSVYALSNAVSACSKGDWYLVKGFCKTLKRDAYLAVNIADNRAYFADIAGSIPFGRQVEYNFTYEFTSGSVDFGTRRKKVLERLEILSEEGVDIEATNGVKTRILRGVKGNAPVKLSGNCFKFTVRGSAGIDGIRAFAEVIDDV